ncbi:MAG: type II toxin-antitoxin system RelE/ParE family toxin [Prevotellaceae bacterium]|jgi:hypothetical protein|nr:type II toxin-antitoxin system RelE/ParE family toxin [Prevotellaceae bacterium]
MKRVIYRSDAFDKFYFAQDSRTQKKIDYVLQIIRDEEVVNTKFVKRLENTEFYEIRISTNNEYRIITLTIDKESFIEATAVLLLNGFIKKSNADYPQQIKIARNVLEKEDLL